MLEEKIIFVLRVKSFCTSWGLQIVFGLWIFLLFVVFAKMDHAGTQDREALALVFENETNDEKSVRMPPPLFAPVEPDSRF